jgi:tetratricopeptide (TPR) repeat protein
MQNAAKNRLLSLVAALLVVWHSAGAQMHPQTVDPVIARGMHEAIEVAKHGDEPRALTLLDELLKQHPGFVPALKLKGMLLEDMGRSQESLAVYERALKLAPKDPELLLAVGTADLVGGHAGQALPLLEQRVRLVPKDEEGLYYLAQAYHLSGLDEQALKTIKEAVEVAPSSAPIAQKYGELLCSSDDFDEATRWLLKAQRMDSKLPRLDFDLGVASYGSQDLEKTVTYAEREAALQPRDVSNLLLLASAQIKLAHWREAEQALDRAAILKPLDASALVLYGHAELEQEKYSGAVDALQRALEQDPTQLLAHFYLAKAYSGLGQKEQAQHEAALHREMMQHIAFSLPKAEQQHADALAEQARKDIAAGHEDQALALYSADSLTPGAGAGTPWVSLASVYLSLGDPASANRCIEKALALDPRTRSAHLYLGVTALQAGDLAAAAKEFDAELAIDSSNSVAQGELGEVRYRQGRFEDAATLIARSRTTNPTLLYILCDSYFHLGKTQNANLTAESAAAYGHGQPQFLDALTRLLAANGQAELAAKLAKSRS